MNAPLAHNNDLQHPPRKWWMLVFWLLVVFAISFAGSVVTMPKIPTWYAGLAKPWFTPPNWLFGPVWTALYAAMALAVWRVGTPAGTQQRRAVGLFVAQLALNGIWSPAFFGLESPLLGLLIIVPLVFLVGNTAIAFWRLDRAAGMLLVPYFLWLIYATLLNTAIYALN
jgi:tryptophan-rich sensory protein